MEDNAEARARLGVADSWAEKNIAYDEQGACGRAGHKTSGMATRAGPESSLRQHQDRANKRSRWDHATGGVEGTEDQARGRVGGNTKQLTLQE